MLENADTALVTVSSSHRNIIFCSSKLIEEGFDERQAMSRESLKLNQPQILNCRDLNIYIQMVSSCLFV